MPDVRRETDSLHATGVEADTKGKAMSIATEHDDSDELDRLRKRVAELESALRPFAAAGAQIPREWPGNWKTHCNVGLAKWLKAVEVMTQ